MISRKTLGLALPVALSALAAPALAGDISFCRLSCSIVSCGPLQTGSQICIACTGPITSQQCTGGTAGSYAVNGHKYFCSTSGEGGGYQALGTQGWGGTCTMSCTRTDIPPGGVSIKDGSLLLGDVRTDLESACTGPSPLSVP